MMMSLIADIQRVIVNHLTTVTWQSLISHNDAQYNSCKLISFLVNLKPAPVAPIFYLNQEVFDVLS